MLALVLRSYTLRDRLCISAFVEDLFFETDGEGFHRSGTMFCHHRDDQGAINSSRKECPQRHIADHARAYTASEDRIELVQQIVFPPPLPGNFWSDLTEVPIPLDLEA